MVVPESLLFSSDFQTLASRDTTPENREFFKNELASAIRDIREEYDQVRLPTGDSTPLY